MVERADQRREMGEPSWAVLSSTHDIRILLRFFWDMETCPQKVHSWAGHWIHRRYWQRASGGTWKFRILWAVLKSMRAWPWGVLPATCQSCYSCSLAPQVRACSVWRQSPDTLVETFLIPTEISRKWANSTLSFTNYLPPMTMMESWAMLCP